MRLFTLALLAAGLMANHASAGVILSYQQVGNDVVATGTGTLNLAALNFNSNFSGSPVVSPSGRLFLVGSAGNATFYGVASGPISFGSGGVTFATSATGDLLGISVNFLAVPQGYVFGNMLSGTATFSNMTFSSLGLNPGTYAFTWGSAATADFLTIQVGPASPSATPIPEPATLVVFGGLALAGAVGYRRRKAAVTPR